MCTYVGSDIIIANMLNENDTVSISFRDIVNTCDAIKNQLQDKRRDYYFDIYQDSIEETVNSYKSLFSIFGDKISLKDTINLDFFNSKYPEEISEAIKKVIKAAN